ncbi:MAG: hypothetical protein PHX08_18165 [Lachnospiraceae bacterium]|nr:hypothetical protein [Lachnospiraceae bacterium]
MKEIISVLGKISPKEVGFCQCHEHILLSKGKSFALNPALCIDDIKKSICELIRYKEAGGSTIIDAQPIGCNRMTEELAHVSTSSNVNIISSTGFHKLSFYSNTHWIHNINVQTLGTIFTRELTEGMFINTDTHFPDMQCTSRAGIIKTALDTEGLTPRYQTLFNAAILAALDTHQPIMIHVEQNTNPIPLLDFLLNKGLPGNQLIFCHLDRACKNFDIHRKIASSGAYIEYDTIGRFKYHSDYQEILLIKQLISNGYENQLLLSLDTTSERLKSYSEHAIGLDYIIKKFIPLMSAQHITKDQINLFTVHNAVRALT